MLVNENYIKSLENKLNEFEKLFNKLIGKMDTQTVTLNRNREELRTLFSELNLLKRETSLQPLSRVREISAFADRAHSKIREIMNIVLEIKDGVAEDLVAVEEKIKTDFDNKLSNHLKVAAIFISIIFTLTGVVYYDIKTDIKELQTSKNK